MFLLFGLNVTYELGTLQIENAKATEAKIDEELKDLQATLANIEEVRPFDELTVRTSVTPPKCLWHANFIPLQVEEVGDAHPEIRKAVETMVTKGKWTVPGKLHAMRYLSLDLILM